MNWFFRIAIACCFLLLFSFSAAAEKPLVLAVHPYLPEAEIQKRFQPLVEYLRIKLDRPVEVRVGGDYQDHIYTIGNDKVDVAFLGPVGYVRVVKSFGVKPVLAAFEVNHNPYLYGVIATRQDSNLNELKDLANKRFAFGDSESTMSHIVPRYLLIRAGIPNGAPLNHQFLGSHINVALGILSGDFDAGAMKREVFDQYERKGLRIMAITPGVPDHLFVARGNLPRPLLEKLRDALLEIKNAPGGLDILKAMHKDLTGLIAATDKDYDELRHIVQEVDQVSQ